MRTDSRIDTFHHLFHFAFTKMVLKDVGSRNKAQWKKSSQQISSQEKSSIEKAQALSTQTEKISKRKDSTIFTGQLK